jgi:hypothetical protein
LLLIPYINNRCSEWARWWLSGGSRLSVVSSIYRLKPGEYNPEGAAPEAVIPINDMDACKTDQAIAALRRVSPVLGDTLMAFYLRTAAPAFVAQDLGVSERALYKRIERAHQQILGYLNDIEAGVPLPAALAASSAHRARPFGPPMSAIRPLDEGHCAALATTDSDIA